jgi:hypothetical protein
MTTLLNPILQRSIAVSDLVTRWLDLVAEIGSRFSVDDPETALPQDPFVG